MKSLPKGSLRRRRLSAIATGATLTLAAAVALAGCSQQAPTSSSDKNIAPITVWYQAGAGADTRTAYLEQWSKESGVPVKVSVQAADQFQQALQLALRTGKGPDVFASPNAPTLAQAGYLLALDGVLSADTKTAYAKTLKGFTQFIYKGKPIALITSSSTMRLSYNRDLFKAAGLDPNSPPQTLSELVSDCSTIAKKVPGSYGFGIPLGWAGWTDWMLDAPVLAGNKNLVRNNYDRKTQRFEPEVAAPAIEAFREMIKNGCAYPGASSLGNDAMRDAFAQGKIGMYISMSSDAALIDTDYKSKIDWAAARLPVLDNGSYLNDPLSVGAQYSINSKTKDPKDAGKVLDALASKELSTKLANAGVIVSTRAGVKPDAPTADFPKQLKAFLPDDKSNVLIAPPQIAITGDTFLQTATALVLNTADVKATLAALADKYNQALDTGVKNGTIDLKQF